MNIVSDSKFVINGLTTFLSRWEDNGWLGVKHQRTLKTVVGLLRSRSAKTTFRWVKGHTGLEGNEGADRLAAAGCQMVPEPCRLQDEDMGSYVMEGAKLSGITQKLAYRFIRRSKQASGRRATDRVTARILATLNEDWKLFPTAERLWKNLLRDDVRRSMRNFMWKSMHHVLKVGEYWENIPGYEHRAVCALCGVTENLEHILVECSHASVAIIWGIAKDFLAERDINLPPISFGAILGAPSLKLSGVKEKSTSGMDRLTRIVIMESAHLLWKLRCERVIDPEFVPATGQSKREVVAKWVHAIDKRLQVDRGLVLMKGPSRKTVTKDLVLDTWRQVVNDFGSLPDDWICTSGVLVGSSAFRRRHGIG
ncbi:RnaseH-domain-containing protein [Trametes sanguinea]|nr:RnaseH-domain-containing protein [Trametes sanguinea]